MYNTVCDSRDYVKIGPKAYMPREHLSNKMLTQSAKFEPPIGRITEMSKVDAGISNTQATYFTGKLITEVLWK